MAESTLAPLLTPGQVAARLGIPLQTLYRWRSAGAPSPRAVRVGKHLRFTEAAVAEFIEAQTEAA